MLQIPLTSSLLCCSFLRPGLSQFNQAVLLVSNQEKHSFWYVMASVPPFVLHCSLFYEFITAAFTWNQESFNACCFWQSSLGPYTPSEPPSMTLWNSYSPKCSQVAYFFVWFIGYFFSESMWAVLQFRLELGAEPCKNQMFVECWDFVLVCHKRWNI